MNRSLGNMRTTAAMNQPPIVNLRIDPPEPKTRYQSWLAAGALALASCAPLSGYRTCEAVPPARLALAPPKLSQTGLFADMGSEQLAPGVTAYAPRFQLWSDGDQKRRWVYLPPGTQIESSDMDAWRFPMGTKLWKEFGTNGVRVETRLLEKVGPGEGDWLAVAYLWSSAPADAVLQPAGMPNALGTSHDVPSADQCLGCHGGTRSRVLGFSAVQLAHEAPEGELNLARLSEQRWLTHAPPQPLVVPGEPLAREALGYLHANCSHCHNQHRPQTDGPRCFDPKQDFDLSLRSTELGTVWATATYRSTLGDVVLPGDPEGSQLFQCARSATLFRARMPPLATKGVDAQGLALIASWIRSLEPAR